MTATTKSVRSVLAERKRDVPSISPEANVYAAMTLMAERNLGSLVVLDKKRLVGTLHERDCLEKIMLWGQRSRETKVREVMRQNPMTVRPEDSMETCVLYLLTERATQLPVIEKGMVIGIIGIEDVLRLQIKGPGVLPQPQLKIAAATGPVNKKNDRVWSGRILN